ncbi:MAG TPA: transglycosylase domain-containing protein, partial [Pseudoxanthomonas mexicana]|nr:transglycosylase domain-containing protein [Pseudoxanthomonas mexicana]
TGTTEPPAATGAAPAVEASDAPAGDDPFEQVERKVSALRERYEAGSLTRDELQAELRHLMILDDDGHWWMLGLESNRWYYYDGRDWVASTPPGHSVVRGSAVRTETGLQQVVQDGPLSVSADTSSPPTRIELDEDGMPLPRRVPMEDPGATMVSPSAAFIEPVRRSEAKTQQRTPQIDADAAATIANPIPGVGSTSDMTLRTEPVRTESSSSDMGATLPGRTPAVPAGATVAGAAAVSGDAISKPKPKLGEFPQPDYSAAFGPARNRAWYTKWGVRLGVIGIIGGMLVTLLVLIGMIGYYFYVVSEYRSEVSTLNERASSFETTEIYDGGGGLLAEFSNLENPDTGARKEVDLANISPWVIQATIATENETFYTDPGFSVFAIVRAVVQNVQAGSTVSGASTLTQQLARALVLESDYAYDQSVERKVNEVIVASEITRKYTKNEILEIYLNEFFYGNFSYGIEAASETYFGIPASELNPAQAAFLAGLPQSPAAYDPVLNHEAAMLRMKDVLRLMSEANGTGCIAIQHQDQTQWQVPQGGSLCIIAHNVGGDVVYYYQTPNMAQPEELTVDIALVETADYQPPEFKAEHPHFVNYVWQQLEDTYGSQAIYNAGFHVYTTLDETVQAAAEQAVTQNLSSLQAAGNDIENASVVVMRPQDAAVVAMVGSADYYNEDIDGQVNVAFTGQQPGSSIKPIVYLAALTPNADGKYWTPATVIWDVPSDFNGYQPTNYDMLFHGPQTLRNSLGNSLNIPAVKALDFVTVERFTEFAKKVGLTFPLGDPIERNAGLTAALGAVEVRLFDMVGVYTMLANNGAYKEPYAISRIEDSDGNVIFQASTETAGTQVVPAEYAYLMTSILSDADARANEFGYGAPMQLSGNRPAAIKTGTTNESRDIWTIGYTPQYTVGVWVGNTDNRPMYGMTGYYGAAPIWNQIMETIHQGLPVQDFPPPAGLVQAEVCDDSGARPSSACAGRTHVEIFAAAAPPPDASQDIFQQLEVDTYTGLLANDSCRDEAETRTFLKVNDPTAYTWINNTAEGNQWAAARGVQTPVQPPPTEYCDPNAPRPYVVFSTPIENATVEGTIQLRGAITMPDFNRYEVRFGVSNDPQAFSQPFIVDTNQRSQGESVLGEWDTRTVDNGQYTLRLVAIDNFGRSVTRDVHLTVNNAQPTALPTSTLAPTPTPGAPGASSL